MSCFEIAFVLSTDGSNNISCQSSPDEGDNSTIIDNLIPDENATDPSEHPTTDNPISDENATDPSEHPTTDNPISDENATDANNDNGPLGSTNVTEMPNNSTADSGDGNNGSGVAQI